MPKAKTKKKSVKHNESATPTERISNVLKTKKRHTWKKAERNRWGSDHFYYINQLLGDQTLRDIIQQKFKNTEGWRLAVEKGFNGGSHHFCERDNITGTEKWCSQCVGLQNITRYPNDSLCHSYSMMKYLGLLTKRDTELTRDLQVRMANMWLSKIRIPEVKDQIIHSVKQIEYDEDGEKVLRDGSYWFMKEIDPRYRNGQVIKVIENVLNEWKEYGYKYYINRDKKR